MDLGSIYVDPIYGIVGSGGEGFFEVGYYRKISSLSRFSVLKFSFKDVFGSLWYRAMCYSININFLKIWKCLFTKIVTKNTHFHSFLLFFFVNLLWMHCYKLFLRVRNVVFGWYSSVFWLKCNQISVFLVFVSIRKCLFLTRNGRYPYLLLFVCNN